MRNVDNCAYCKAVNGGTSLYGTYDIFGNQYTINRCRVCKAHYLSPNPTVEQLAKAYDISYYGEQVEKFTGLTEKTLDYFRKQRAARVSSYVPENGRILDIGCGNGRFLKHTLLFGRFSLYGIEIPGKSAERAAAIPEITLKVGNLQAGDYSDGFFDAVTLFHVFEHLSEPMDTLGIISRILKKGGVCVMSFPNIDSFQARIFKGKWLHLDPPRHLFFFKPGDFANIITNYDLGIEKTGYISLEQNPFGAVQSILNCFSRKREVLYESLKGNREYVNDISKSVLFIHRLFFVITFPIFVLLDLVESLFGKGATVQFVLRKT
jgi:SAM-dependent methyltransferase